MRTSLSSSVQIALCGESDVKPLMRFIHESWAEDHVLSRDEALLRWQYDPQLGGDIDSQAPTVLLAWADGRIVGMLGLTFMRWLYQGRIYRGAWTSNWVVAPQVRGLSVAIELIHAAREMGAEVLGSLGANAISTRIVRGLGFDIMDEIPRWVAVTDSDATAALLAAAGQDHRPKAGVLPTEDRSEAYESVPWSAALAGSWDACWRGSIAPAFAGATRDSAYITWRYVRHPTFRYHVTLARDRSSGRVTGLAAFRVEQVRDRPERVLRIADLLTASAGAADSLVHGLMHEAHKVGAAFVDFYCSRPMPALEKAGFRIEGKNAEQAVLPSRFQPLESGGRTMNAVIRLPNGSGGELAGLAARGSLYLTKSDGDQDRPA